MIYNKNPGIKELLYPPPHHSYIFFKKIEQFQDPHWLYQYVHAYSWILYFVLMHVLSFVEEFTLACLRS